MGVGWNARSKSGPGGLYYYLEYDNFEVCDISENQYHSFRELLGVWHDVREQTLSAGTRRRVIRSLSWLIEDAKYRHDDCKNNIENGSEGGYSPELIEVIELLDELKKGNEQPDEDLLAAAYRKGFEDAKKQIAEKIQALVKRE